MQKRESYSYLPSYKQILDHRFFEIQIFVFLYFLDFLNKFLDFFDLVENQKIEGEAIRINDIYFGNVDVFYNSVRQTIDNTEHVGSVKVVYQGCNEKGFCYPPISKEIQVDNLENF